MQVIHAITILLCFQLLGEILVRYFSLVVPGPVLGMALLFVTLILRNCVDSSLEKTAAGLLSHLSLLFVPAGVGIMVHFDRVADEWFAIGVSLVVSTAITLAVSAGIMYAVARWSNDTKNQERY